MLEQQEAELLFQPKLSKNSSQLSFDMRAGSSKLAVHDKLYRDSQKLKQNNPAQRNIDSGCFDKAPKSHRRSTSGVGLKLHQDAKNRELRRQNQIQKELMRKKREIDANKNTQFPVNRLINKNHKSKTRSRVENLEQKHDFKPSISRKSDVLAERSRIKSKNLDFLKSEESKIDKNSEDNIYERRTKEKEYSQIVLQTMKTQKEIDVRKECTFKPNIGKKSLKRPTSQSSTIRETDKAFNSYLNTLKKQGAGLTAHANRNSQDSLEDQIQKSIEKLDPKKQKEQSRDKIGGMKQGLNSKSVRLIKTVKPNDHNENVIPGVDDSQSKQIA